MPLQLYNSYSRAKELFTPLDSTRVTLYACGPTVYNRPHVGNARAAVVFDLLYRVLTMHFENVVYVRNITDVDDKINAAAAAEGVPIDVISARYTAAYHQDMEALSVLTPTVEPRATETMDQIVAMIETLIASGHAYEAAEHVLFDVTSFTQYGALSGRDRDEMIAGARVEVAPHKRDPADFVLWKPSADGQPGWESPWGRGRPGWHIECSAMIERHLGTTIDIHGGGNDLKFPHHENEIAQSTCAHGGETFARYWVHNGFVQIDNQKMSKSIGNVLLVEDMLRDVPGEVIRLALLSARYREPLNWNDDLLTQTKAALDKFYGALRGRDEQADDAVDPGIQAFWDALDDDLNTPLAISVLHDLTSRLNSTDDESERTGLVNAIRQAGRGIGILNSRPDDWFQHSQGHDVDAAWVEQLIGDRKAARANRDFNRADEIRDELAAAGVTLEDGPAGTKWRVGG